MPCKARKKFPTFYCQEDTDDIDEEDGKNEYIFTCDGDKILDNELYDAIIKPLHGIKCSLTAVLDCCHSGSLLDLPHSHCNNVYVPWLSKGRRRTKTMWANCRRDDDIPFSMQLPIDTKSTRLIASTHLIAGFPGRSASSPSLLNVVFDCSNLYPMTIPSTSRSPPRQPCSEGQNICVITELSDNQPNLDVFMSPTHYTSSPTVIYKYCTGMCREDQLFDFEVEKRRYGVEVVCLSASKDHELAWQDGEGRSMTQYLIENLNKNPQPTWHNLLTSISHNIHSFYVNELHDKARSYKKNLQKAGMRDQDPMASVVEMHNFQNPQLSSFVPLNMDQPFDP